MVEVNAFYKCGVCGNLISVISAGQGDVVCCGESMKKLEEQTIEQEGKEKHVPVISIDGNNVTVKIGSVEHPMEKSHYIQLIQVIKEGKIIVGKRLLPGNKPEASFCLGDTSGLQAREICNMHGLWISK